MSAPADQMPSSFDASTQTSMSSSKRTSSIIVLRSRIRSGHPIVAELREAADTEEPPVREEDEIVFAQSVPVLALLRETPQDRLRLLAVATGLRLDDRHVHVPDLPADLVDVDGLCLSVLQRLEDALHQVSAELRAEHLEPAGIP